MNNVDLKNSTFSFTVRIIHMAKSVRWNDIDKILIWQLVRSSSSVTANYRAALRAKSTQDFLYKLKIVQEESDECYFWIELIVEAGIISKNKLGALLKEASELTAIFTAQCKTVRTKLAVEKNSQIKKNLKSHI